MSDTLMEAWSEEAQSRLLRRNYIAMTVDGGLYFAGMAFIAADTVFPALLKELGASTWLVALAPTLGMYGYFLVPLFSAGMAERLSQYRNFIAWVSVPQRALPLFAGLALLFLADARPVLVLWIVALTPLTISLVGGVTMPAFWELFAKILPARRRASNMAARQILSTIFGILAGGVIAAILLRWPGPPGFGVLFLLCFVFLMLSLVALCRVRELPHRPRRPSEKVGWRKTLGSLPRHWREDERMRRFVLARMCGTGVGVLTPFLAIHALQVLKMGPAFLGTLVVAQNIGAILGGAVAGWLGDRRGGRIVALLGGVCAVIMCAGVLVNRSLPGFLVIFLLLGATTFLSFNGSTTLMLELFPAERRPTYVAIISLLTLPAMLMTAWAAGFLRTVSGALWPAAITAAVLVATSIWFYRGLHEPRTTTVATNL